MAFSHLRRENFTAADGLGVGGGLGRSKLEVQRGGLLGGEGRGAVVKTGGELCFPEGAAESSVTAIAGQGHPKTPGQYHWLGRT